MDREGDARVRGLEPPTERGRDHDRPPRARPGLQRLAGAEGDVRGKRREPAGPRLQREWRDPRHRGPAVPDRGRTSYWRRRSLDIDAERGCDANANPDHPRGEEARL